MIHKNFNQLVIVIFISLFILCPAIAQGGTFSIGGFGGYAWSVIDEAVDGFPDTEFSDSGVFGGSLMYRFNSGFALEFVVENFEMDLEERGEDFGTLEMTPIMLLLRYQGMPQGGKGFAGHGGIGAGINLTKFSNGTFIKDLERTFDVAIDLDTDDSFIFEVGGGLDYFFNKNFSMFLDARLLLGNVDVNTSVSGYGTSVEIDQIDSFQASNIQALLGLRIWF